MVKTNYAKHLKEGHLIQPKDYIRICVDKNSTVYDKLREIIIAGGLTALENCFKNAEGLDKPTIKAEPLNKTLKKHVENYAPTLEPTECFNDLINNG